mmetsp:Transcript_53938/g.131007  ORF Transcript_53938/g.131007 Transcript_53938/m.131007 type:complete len:101 (+) Transcript_53938:846-1148(+)
MLSSRIVSSAVPLPVSSNENSRAGSWREKMVGNEKGNDQHDTVQYDTIQTCNTSKLLLQRRLLPSWTSQSKMTTFLTPGCVANAYLAATTTELIKQNPIS